jgi:hypothetical protein
MDGGREMRILAGRGKRLLLLGKINQTQQQQPHISGLCAVGTNRFITQCFLSEQSRKLCNETSVAPCCMM